MKNSRMVLIVMAALFVAGWIMGNFFFQAGNFIHIFIITAAILGMQAIIISPKPQANNS